MNLDVHKTVLENKETETGCTLHLVTEEVDGGAILMQKSTQIVGMIKHILNTTLTNMQKEILQKPYEIVYRNLSKTAFWNAFKTLSMANLNFRMNKQI